MTKKVDLQTYMNACGRFFGLWRYLSYVSVFCKQCYEEEIVLDSSLNYMNYITSVGPRILHKKDCNVPLMIAARIQT